MYQDPIYALLIGAPGSGKSTFAARHFPPDAIASTDRSRILVCGTPANMAAQPAALRVVQAVVEGRLEHQMPVVVDATNTEPGKRGALLAAGRRWNRPTIAIVLATPLDVCLHRNALRTGPDRVPEPFIRDCAARIAAEFPPGGDRIPSGFAGVVKVPHDGQPYLIAGTCEAAAVVVEYGVVVGAPSVQ